MQRIGILGGTFNPIHKGHIQLGKAAYEQFHLDKILVLPNKLPAYKELDELLDTTYRSQMVKLAIKEYPYMEFSDIELKRAGATYTIDTLRSLTKLYPNDTLFFILGGDSLVYLHKWREYKEILKLAKILCAKRAEADLPRLQEIQKQLLQEVPEAAIFFLDTPMIPISSTELREKLYQDRNVLKWLPEGVWDYIRSRNLYKGLSDTEKEAE